MGNCESTDHETHAVDCADRSPKIAHLINTAGLLFAKYGFHAIGVDQIIAESRIAKMTMYRNFPTKKDLIVAVLTNRRDAIKQELMGAIVKKNSPSERLSAIF